jgi:hypothetical protein
MPWKETDVMDQRTEFVLRAPSRCLFPRQDMHVLRRSGASAGYARRRICPSLKETCNLTRRVQRNRTARLP